MKYWQLFFLLPLTLAAQEWDQDLFKIENSPSPLPFAASATYLSVAPASFRTKGFTKQELTYQQWDAAFVYNHPLSTCSGLIFGAGWIGSTVDMEQNPNFNKKDFNYVNFSFGGYTTSFPDWIWTLTFGGYLDVGNFSLVDYALYHGNLWGRYDLCDSLELDFGFMVEVGLRKERVWPIIGFLYTPCPQWRLSMIYPIDISLGYDISRTLTLSGSVRFLRNRHRVGEEERNPQAIFEYRTAGIEADLIWCPYLWLCVTGFVGSTVDGDLEVSDRNHDQSIHYKFKGSFYAGATLISSF